MTRIGYFDWHEKTALDIPGMLIEFPSYSLEQAKQRAIDNYPRGCPGNLNIWLVLDNKAAWIIWTGTREELLASQELESTSGRKG